MQSRSTNQVAACTSLVVVMLIATSLSGATCQKTTTTKLPPWLTKLNTTTKSNATESEKTTLLKIPAEPAKNATETKETTTLKMPTWKRDRLEKSQKFKETPADVVISAVLAEPLPGQKEFIQLKNLGGQDQDLNDWKLSLENMNGDDPNVYVFKSGNECPSKIESQGSLLLHKHSGANPCGFKFALGPSEQLILFEAGEGAEGVDSMSWGNVQMGNVLYRVSDDEYERAPRDVQGNIMTVLAKLGEFKNMITFLDYFGLDKILEGKGTRSGHRWFDKIVREMDASKPYTLFAIKDDAWTSLFKEMAGEWAPPLTASELLEIDDKMVFDIITFLMLEDSWNSRSLKLKMRDQQSMAFQTAHPERKAILQLDKSGSILLNYDCVDSPSPDEYGCAMQRTWGKCSEDWMNDNGFFSGRPLGFCEYECGKCYCDPMDDNCAKAVVADVTASLGKDGVVHVIDRLIKAPPILKPQNATTGEEDTKTRRPSTPPPPSPRRSSPPPPPSRPRYTFGWWG